MHDFPTIITAQSVVHSAAAPEAAPVRAAALAPLPQTVPLNAPTPLGATLAGNTGQSVDVIDNLNQGALYRFLPGVPPGPRTRTYALTGFPDTGGGNLGLPAIGAVPGSGAVTPVDDNGVPVASGATGISLTGSAYLQSLTTLPALLSLSGGWAITLVLRAPVGAKNSGRMWACVGRRFGTDYGVSISETSSGQLNALVEDPRHATVKAQSNVYPHGSVQTARLVWNSATQVLQWFIGGVASGAAAPLTWLPEFGTGNIIVGTNLALTVGLNPIGDIHGLTFEQTGADQTSSYVPVGPSETMGVADARSLTIDTTGLYAPVANAGDISLGYQTASGYTTQDYPIAVAGYAAPVETLTSYVSGEMAYCPIDVGQTRDDLSTLVLTPPTLGKLQVGPSTFLAGAGALSPVSQDGIAPPYNYLFFQPIAGGTASGQNPRGSTTRGYRDVVRTQQGSAVRVTNVIEMNRAPRLNGGGEAWGHAADIWVPIHALWYGYDDNSYLFPTLDNETPAVTVTQVPGPGEGTVRVLRTGPDLVVGSSVAFADVRRLGWYKPSVAAVGAGCALGLAVAAPGAPTGAESYALKITDAPRPAAIGYWDQADTNYTDKLTRARWANKGGDWAGQDGLWGATPFAQTAPVTKAATVAIDVTQMAKAGGIDFFLMASGTGTVTVQPGLSNNAALEPILRVTGGARAGDYPPVRSAGLAPTDGTGWAPSKNAAFPIKRGQPLLLGFDGAGTAATLQDATLIQLVLTVTSVSSGGGAVQVFRPAAQPPRPGPRASVTSTPTAQRSDLLCKVDTNADWLAMLNGVNGRQKAGSGQPANFTVANGCYYGGIAQGANTGLNLFNGFWDANGQGYTTVRFGRMVGWHINYQPGDAFLTSPINFSGKSPGIIATQNADLSVLGAGYGGRQISGFSAYTCRMERGSPTLMTHGSTSPLAGWLAFGDYDYFLSGNTNGETTNGINPLPRMAWVWIETVHQANSLHADGTWANDGVFELYVNGRKQCESRRLEWRVFGNAAGWDTIWFDEYNGGQGPQAADRLWPFVIGPSYVVNGTAPIAPPPGWNVPFVTAAGVPDTVPLAYVADLA